MKQVFLNNNKTAKGSRMQFPLMYCWAVTIPFLQGMTLDKIVVEMDLKKGRFNSRQAFLAMSRVKSLNGLFLKH